MIRQLFCGGNMQLPQACAGVQIQRSQRRGLHHACSMDHRLRHRQSRQ